MLPPADLAALIEEGEALLEYEGTPARVAGFTARLEAVPAAQADSHARFLLLRGLARYLDSEVDDARARDDYLQVLAVCGEDASSRVRALCRLAQLETYESRWSAAEAWLDEAAAALRWAPDPALLGELALRRGRLSIALDRPDAGQFFGAAASSFRDAGLAARWLDSRTREVEFALSSGVSSRAVDWVEGLERDATALGVARNRVVVKVADVAIDAFALGRREGLAAWVGRLTGADLASITGSLRPGLGRLLWGYGRLDEAYQMFREAGADGTTSHEDRWFAEVHRLALGVTLGNDSSVDLAARARALPEGGVDASLLIAASKFLLDASRPEEAEELCRVVLADKRASASVRAAAMVNLVGVLATGGRLVEARRVMDEVDGSHFAGDPEMLSVWRLNSGFLSAASGLFEDALEQAEEMLEGLRTAGDPVQLGLGLANALEWTAKAGRPTGRSKYRLELLALLPELGGRARVSSLILLAATGNGGRRARQVAWDMLFEASELAESVGERRLASAALLQFAWSGAAVQPSLSDAAFREVVRLAPNDHDLRGSALSGRGQLCWLHNRRGAGRLFSRAARAFARAGHAFDEADNWDWVARCYPDEPGRALPHGRRAFRQVRSLVEHCATPLLRERSLARMRPIGMWLMRLHLMRGDAPGAIQTVYQLKAGQYASRRAHQLLSPQVAAAVEAALHAQLVEPTTTRDATTVRNCPPAAPALPSVQRLGGPGPADRRVADGTVSADSVRGRIGRNEAAVEYVLDRAVGQVVIFVVRHDGVEVLKRRWSRGLTEAAAEIGEVLAGRRFGGDPAWLFARLRDLYDVLVRPLGRLLRGVERLWVAPGGLLSEVPFAALLDQHGVPLVDRLDVRQVLTTAQLVTLPARRLRMRQALVLRGSDAGSGRLEHADAECLSVAERLKSGGVLVAESATALSTADIVHFAGHARFDREAGIGALSLPGLDLSDHAVSELSLKRRPLLVLSACESGRTAAGLDGFTGFLRGAFAAGARDVLCSGWPADDAATAELMALFYGRLMGGLSPAPALRAASIELRHSSAARVHPFYWANFRCVGIG